MNNIQNNKFIINSKKRKKEKRLMLTSTNENSFSNQESIKYELETSQQVKRLKLLSFNPSPLLNKTNQSFANILSHAAQNVANAFEISSTKMKSLTSKLIELNDDDLNSNSVDSGFSQMSNNVQQDEVDMVMLDLNGNDDDDESDDSNFTDEDMKNESIQQEDENENDASFRISKSKNLKLLDISNCSINSNNSINSPYQARRCLFKTGGATTSGLVRSPLATNNNSPYLANNKSITNSCSSNNSNTKTKLQITPISISRHNSIITNDVDQQQKENELILSTLFNSESEKDEKQKQIDNENIMKMLDLEHRSFIGRKADFEEGDRRLIGDRSSYHILPCTTSIKHNDLNVITPATLTRVLNGEFDSQIDKLIIIDSRYPYEYDGGHIRNAQNIYTKENIVEMFLDKNNENSLLQHVTQNKENDNRRVLVIFHCEFSSERGPGLLRFLRSQDRLLNKETYPKLFYPELYLLEGGYKSFYEQHKDYCEPKLYKPMLHKDHVEDLKHFRAKTKTWESQYKFLTNHYASTQKVNPAQSRLLNKTNALRGIQRFPRSTLF